MDKNVLEDIVYPVILAGGSGTRLWPLSRQSYPKQFSKLFEGMSLFQQTALRMSGFCEIDFAKPITVTNNDFRFIVADQLQSAGVDPGPIIIEPMGRNTAPAVIAAALEVFETNPNGIMVIVPSDHSIPDTQAFHKMLLDGITAVKTENLVTFGVKPRRPETGYGYIKSGSTDGGISATVTRFVEKPSLSIAKSFIESENYLWNTGIFMFRAKNILVSAKLFCPEIFNAVEQSFLSKYTDLGFLRLEKTAWERCESVSIDHAIMEKASNIRVVPFDGSWSDLGNWNSVWEESQSGTAGVSISGNVTTVECSNSLLRSESPNQHLVCIGLNNIVAIAMNDAVLVSQKDRSQDVKEIVQELSQKGVSQAQQLPKDYRPWGWFETLATGDFFKIKQIFVVAGGSLSLQSHKHRSEHWVVVEGTATVTIEGKKLSLNKGESTFIPLGAKHRLENKGTVPTLLVEVQIGSYFGEDDIIRFDDAYKRE